MTLRTKTMLILALTVMASLGGSGVIFLSYFKKTFQQSAFQIVDSVARNNVHAINNYLRNHRLMLQHFSTIFPSEAAMKKDYHAIESFLTDIYQQFPNFDNGFFFLDTDGILRASYPAYQEEYGGNFSFRRYFQDTMSSKQGVLTHPYRSLRSKEPVLTFTAYLTSPDGKPLGLLGGSIRLTPDSGLAQGLEKRIGKSGYTYVFDQGRMLILHPDKSRVLQRDIAVGANKMFDAALAGFTGPAETINSKGIPMFVAFYPVPGTDWIVASQQPISEALKPLQNGKKPLLFSSILGSLLAALIGMVMVHRNMRDLVQLEAVTGDLAVPDTDSTDLEKDFKKEVEKFGELKQHSEFGSLTKTIKGMYSQLGEVLVKKNKMAEELEAAYQKLKFSQAQILQQEKMASIGQLAAGVAHEINNPIGFIASNLRTLERHLEKLNCYHGLLEAWINEQSASGAPEDIQQKRRSLKIDFVLEDIQELIHESSDGTERIRKIVQNLGAFSRVDQVDYGEVDLNECLESTLAIAWNEIKYKAKVEKDYSPLPLVSCYPQQLNQVFLNLLINATQAIENNGEIKIRTWQESNRAKIAISDNGAGISEENRNRIFEPFFTTKDVGKGTGLGLSISYEIIQKHGGEISVASSVGEGTTFTITLPTKNLEA